MKTKLVLLVMGVKSKFARNELIIRYILKFDERKINFGKQQETFRDLMHIEELIYFTFTAQIYIVKLF